jgi:MinD superfamily P-loop ATPase
MAKGLILAIYSPVGGTGVTFTAINLAARMSSASKTGLLDFNDFGLIGDYLNMTGEGGSEVRTQPQSAAISAAGLVQQSKVHQTGMRVVMAPQGSPKAEYFDEVIRDSREMFECTVIDLPHSLSANPVQQTLKSADLICIVADSTTQSSIAVAKCATLMEKMRPGSRVKIAVVLNKTMSLMLHGTSAWGHPRNSSDATKRLRAAQIEVFHSLPEDRMTVKWAMNKGEVVTRAAIGKSLDELATKIRKRIHGGMPTIIR